METEIPGPVIVPTPVPGPTIVATPMPFWIRQITGILQAEAEIQVQVVGVHMDAAEALRGQGLLSAVISSMDLAPADQFLRGQASIWAVIAGDREVEYPVHLEGRGEILASGVAMILSAGVRSLAGRGAVTAGGISTALQALVNLRGQGRVTATPTAMKLTDPTARLLAGRGAITVTGVSQALSFMRQRMDKSGTFTPTQNTTTQVTGWASNSSYPATVTNNRMVIQGGGATLVWTVNIAAASSGSAVTIQVMHNETQVDSFSARTEAVSRTGSRAFTAGDTLWIRAVASGFGSFRSIPNGSYVDLAAP